MRALRFRLAWQPVWMGCIAINWEQTLELEFEEAEELAEMIESRRNSEMRSMFKKR